MAKQQSVRDGLAMLEEVKEVVCTSVLVSLLWEEFGHIWIEKSSLKSGRVIFFPHLHLRIALYGLSF